MIRTLTQHLDPARTPQTEALPGRADMEPNNGGGFSFELDDWARLERFLILGSEGGTYYVGERKLTLDNVAVVLRCLNLDGVRTVKVIREISMAGRAPKNDAAIFALALTAGKAADMRTRQAARLAVPAVCRTGTHLFQFLEACKTLEVGWGRGQRHAVASWYTERNPSGLAYQLVKYKRRESWSHRDALRLSHAHVGAPESLAENATVWGPKSELAALLHYAVKGWPGVGVEPHPDRALRTVWAAERALVAELPEVINLITDHRLPWECVRSEHLREPAVWEALLPHMGLGALVRNLGRMTACGLLAPLSQAAVRVHERLSDPEAIRGARLHPVALLNALRVYASGKGVKGSLTWDPNSLVLLSLERAFPLAFDAVPAMNQRVMLALDVSGSMSMAAHGSIVGMAIMAREASAALALVTAKREPQHEIVAFSNGLLRLPGVSTLDLRAFTGLISGLPFSHTDCALPMLYAAKDRVPVDLFVIYTDNETNAYNSVHPCVALKQYRQAMGIPAKLVVCAMSSSGFTIADPNDGGSLDVVGFDTAVPSLIHDFATGAASGSEALED